MEKRHQPICGKNYVEVKFRTVVWGKENAEFCQGEIEMRL